MNRIRLLHISALAIVLALAGLARAQDDKPNILVIFGDDIGYWNVSYNVSVHRDHCLAVRL
ncbi:MAG TPA: hypothetical protein EYQ63_27870, partial [Fuerstia sp.]|nr:hypothetical protein [Fuerstiella sp.]